MILHFARVRVADKFAGFGAEVCERGGSQLKEEVAAGHLDRVDGQTRGSWVPVSFCGSRTRCKDRSGVEPHLCSGDCNFDPSLACRGGVLRRKGEDR
jgi:hypothetical protein